MVEPVCVGTVTQSDAKAPCDRDLDPMRATFPGAAYFPWLARERHPTRNELRPDQVTRASGREVIGRCVDGHEWAAVVYARTLSRSGCPTCYAIETPERIRTGKRRARQVRDEQAAVRVAGLVADAALDDA